MSENILIAVLNGLACLTLIPSIVEDRSWFRAVSIGLFALNAIFVAALLMVIP